MAEEQKRIEVDIGAAFAMLQESPELCAAMNEMVGGPALVAAHAEVDRLVAENRILQAAIKRYGMHEWDCPVNDRPLSGKPCSCGFKEFADGPSPEK